VIEFSGYTREFIQRRMLSRVPGDIDTREGSIIQTAVGPVAWYLEGVYMLLSRIQENAYAETAVGQDLDYICAERGVHRKRAVPAVREGIFDVRIPEGAAFRTIGAADSVVFETGELLSRDDSGYHYRMTCRTSGVAGNFYTGDILPVTAVPGLTRAQIGTVLISGTEEEEDGPLRARYWDTFNCAAFGGNIAAYRSAILAMEGVGAVQVYPVWNGGGTVLCSILDSDLRPPGPGLVELVQEQICPPEDGEGGPSEKGYGMAPVGAAVTVVGATAFPVDIGCRIWLDAPQADPDMYQEQIRQKIQEYLDTVCQSWGRPLAGYRVEYPVSVYVARITAAVLAIDGIVNVTDITLNGSLRDLDLVETAELQQIPVLGEVTVHGN